MSDTNTEERQPARTTPVWGYNAAGESRIFHLNGDELLPKGWFESPALANVEGIDEAGEREHRARMERRAEAVGLRIEPSWTNTRLEAELHRAEVKKAAERPMQIKEAEAPHEEKSQERRAAEVAARIPPVNSGGAESGIQGARIDEATKTSAQLMKERDAKRRADEDEKGKAKLGDGKP